VTGYGAGCPALSIGKLLGEARERVGGHVRESGTPLRSSTETPGETHRQWVDMVSSAGPTSAKNRLNRPRWEGSPNR
jgi:hypothetical protein